MAEREWTAKSRGNNLGYRIFEIFLRYFGVRFAYLNLTYVCLYYVFFSPSSTRALWFYYRRVIGYRRFRSAWSVYLHYFRFAQCIVDKAAIQCGLRDRYQFMFENYDEMLATRDSGDGAIVIGAHVGVWQMGNNFFDGFGARMNIVMVDEEYEFVKKYVDRERLYNVIPVNRLDGLELTLTIKSALDRGEYVCFQGDRYMNEERTYQTTFLGYEAEFPMGPFVLASKLRIPVVIFFSMREGMGYRFLFRRIEAVENGKRLTDREIFEKYKEYLESVVRKYPQQWFNLYRFWKQ